MLVKFSRALSNKGRALLRTANNDELELARRKLTEKDRRLKNLRSRLERKNAELERLRAGNAVGGEAGGVRPESVVWIIGAPRTGSTWLSYMLGDVGECEVWQEPFFGVIMQFRDNIANQGWAANPNFLLGEPNKPIWLKHMRHMFLAVGSSRFSGHGHLVVKEPNGSVGARLVLEALPESKVILLVRDPRDIVASLLDGMKPGSWYGYGRYEASAATARFDPEFGSFDFPLPETEEDLVEQVSRDVAASFAASREAFDAHGGLKTLIKYEDLRSDTLNTVRALCSELEIPVSEGQLLQAVDKHSWENLPKENKGQGKPRRKATPGGWREDLSPKQAKTVESITASLLQEFYPG